MFPLALGESRTKRDQQETNWYFAIEVRACPWTIKNMHKASAKLKLKFLFNKFVCNIGVVKQLRQRRFEREILSQVLFQNTIYQTYPSDQTLGLKLKKQNKAKQNKNKNKRISYIYLNPKTKRISPAGNRTPVYHHYTTEELSALDLGLMGYVMGKRPVSF